MVREYAFPQSSYDYTQSLHLIGEAQQSTSHTPNGDTGNPATCLMLLTLLRRIPMYRLPRSVLLSIPDFAFCDPPTEAVRPRTVNPHARLKFRHLRSFHQSADVRGPVHCGGRTFLYPFHLLFHFERGGGRDGTHGEELFLLSDDGNRETNFAGCVNERHRDTAQPREVSALVATRWEVHLTLLTMFNT